ncbi:unnamed protein product [Vicia faba]|uniref:Uncharacterized protein n=1 Tax=Vicia faba TaxID=3906 RepID=A0AAV1AD46_VICFA|nr:unnamed protein product [Vicia faba]
MYNRRTVGRKGFTPGYWFWTSHGEEAPQMNVDVDMDSNTLPYSSQEDIRFDDADLNDQNFVQNEELPPNSEATEMYDMLNSTHQPAAQIRITLHICVKPC